MQTSEIARRYLDYFRDHDHLIAPSASLISPNPTTLFTIAGMVPFIPYLLGQQTPPKTRMASMQKCVRTLDIDEVGKTTRHGTFFQMLGNFSFGDYFKEEAIHYAWEILTLPQDQGGYGFNPELLWFTVFEDDDEALHMWINEGADPTHIQKLGMADNFWTTGGPGPGGPCTEIFYDRGPAYGKDGGPAVDDNRYIEIWDLVFETYEVDNVKSKTDLHIVNDLQRKNIDTGMGLERVAYLLQGKNNIYETDEVFPVIEAAQKLSGRTYGENEEDDVRFRVVADHVRSALMIMSDGVRPSNIGRGYVLRRLLRRTIRSMKMLGVDDEVMPTLLTASENVMKNSYPEIEETFHDVSEAAYGEEDAFRRTLSKGTEIFDMAVSQAKKSQSADSQPTVSGEDAFKLHDTYGFPIELTLEMASEKGVHVDEKAFRELMAEQRNRARQDALKKRHNVDLSIYDDFRKTMSEPQKFLGYQQFDSRAKVLGILTEQGPVTSVSAPATVEVVLDQTPFYAERGGQQADHGQILSDNGAELEVDDVHEVVKGLTVHQCRLTEGTLAVDDAVDAQIDVARRAGLARSHTATHVLHKALREVLGPQATQRGSVVAPDFLHFDYQWPKAPSRSQIDDVEARVNEIAMEDLQVVPEYMPLKKAEELGADHLFSDKYGDIVRVVTIGDGWSRELCGGTHLDWTGKIGNFVITSEFSNGSGVRRVDAYMGYEGYRRSHAERQLVSTLAGSLNVPTDGVLERVEQALADLKQAQRELADMRLASLKASEAHIVENALANEKNGVVVAASNVGQFGDANQVRPVVMEIREKLGNDKPVVVAIAGTSAEGRPVVFVATNEEARNKGLKAGDMVRTLSQMLGGGGGGRPDFAQGGGKDASAIDAALAQLVSTVQQ
ncbi:alanine--tRNA ligase [Aeriscardovia aeriphila]|uniref:Alanine--tRNA ligase n=1 Tax=Aeriscardovia aeriphila TaxID=218139 RepID=A0A261F9X3_9BIFI|nr:alanine--tRNA ligase [Aeriscardovia aeriphila]NYI25901.1 alanyl-tRNA synthetase [Aeriscardovia aeriphila]OZG55950.1 alanine--tRNA ligase [Aeriscardovia aeriphila]